MSPFSFPGPLSKIDALSGQPVLFFPSSRPSIVCDLATREPNDIFCRPARSTLLQQRRTVRPLLTDPLTDWIERLGKEETAWASPPPLPLSERILLDALRHSPPPPQKEGWTLRNALRGLAAFMPTGCGGTPGNPPLPPTVEGRETDPTEHQTQEEPEVETSPKPDQETAIERLHFPADSETLRDDIQATIIRIPTDFVYQEVNLPQGSTVRLDSSGRLVWVVLGDHAAVIKGMKLPPGTEVEWDRQGNITQVYLWDPATIQGRKFKGGLVLSFDSQGKIQEVKPHNIHLRGAREIGESW